MKRAFCIVLAAVLAFSLVACGSEKKGGSRWFDETIYDYAKTALELVKDYNRGKIDAKEAMERAEKLEKNVEDFKSPETDPNIKLNKESSQSLLATYLFSFRISVRAGSSTSNMETKLQELIDKY